MFWSTSLSNHRVLYYTSLCNMEFIIWAIRRHLFWIPLNKGKLWFFKDYNLFSRNNHTKIIDMYYVFRCRPGSWKERWELDILERREELLFNYFQVNKIICQMAPNGILRAFWVFLVFYTDFRIHCSLIWIHDINKDA